MPKVKCEKLSYAAFVDSVKNYADEHGVDGKGFVEKNAKWLDIYYSNHENKAYTDLIADERFKMELGIPKKKRVVKNGASKKKKEQSS